MSKPVSDASQVASLDATIAALRRNMLPPSRECALLADHLGVVLERLENAEQTSLTMAQALTAREAIAALTGGATPMKQDCIRLADGLGTIRDRVKSWLLAVERKRMQERRGRVVG